MKTKILTLIALLSLGGCKGVPSEYKGDFRDEQKGASLTVKGTQWIFQMKHRTLKGSVAEGKFENLQKGKPGIYVRPYPERKDLAEVFWLSPRADSRREGGGLVWMETDVAYAVLESEVQEKVQQFDLVFSERGLLTLDPESKTYQVGWAAGPEDFHFVRAEKEGGGGLFPLAITLP